MQCHACMPSLLCSQAGAGPRQGTLLLLRKKRAMHAGSLHDGQMLIKNSTSRALT